MLNFNLNDLRQWKALAIGEVMDFEMPASGYRAVHFDVLTSGKVAVHAVTGGEEYWLVAYGEGEMAVKFALDEPFGLVCIGDPGTDVFIRNQVDAPIIPESLEASYTTIEPRPSGPSEDLRRMMHMVRLNQVRREQQLEAERQAERAAFQTQLDALKPEAAPAAPEAPAQVVE